MNSVHDNWCSHQLGFPIRKSPDHRMLASPRGLSQLATSFIAFLRQGIPTHALSSLTIKFTHNTEQTHGSRGRNHGRRQIFERPLYSIRSLPAALIYTSSPFYGIEQRLPRIRTGTNLCSARQYSIFKQQSLHPDSGLRKPGFCWKTAASDFLNNWWAWVDSNYRPHPYQGCALTN